MNKLTFGVLALACVAAAGGGAYLATRQSQTVVTAGTDGVLAPAAGESPAVTATETIVEDVLNLPAEAPAAPGVAPAPSQPASREPARAPAARAPEPAPRPQPVERAERPASPPSRPAPPRREETKEVEPLAEAAPQIIQAPAPFVVASPPAPAPPPEPTFEELIVSADSVLGLQIDTAVSSEQAELEDRVQARVTRDVKVGNDVAIPAGSRVEGSVTLVEKGGKVKESARLGIRFHTLVLADGSRVALSTETLFRDGESPTGESAAKIGGAAVGGAILGAIFGGGKGATIGGAVGAGAGTAATMAGDRNAATLPAGSTVTVRILAPVTVTIEQ
jgi:hypothetical protein